VIFKDSRNTLFLEISCSKQSGYDKIITTYPFYTGIYNNKTMIVLNDMINMGE